jgi:peptidoglycan/xylan/chitin deacetylase (PgdA/CDA1 family)
MYFVKTPAIIKFFYPNVIWNIKGKEKTIFLTFDDGPDKEVTPAILDILQTFDAKATFFCVGRMAVKHPELVEKIKNMGHSIGNHTYHHTRGIHKNTNEFIHDIERCNDNIQSKFFRPPYGKITFSQIKRLKSKYNIILWSLLPGDFDRGITKEKCLERALKYTKGGSIIVFHNNVQSKEKVLFVLPEFLDRFSKLGYTFEPLKEEMFH